MRNNLKIRVRENSDFVNLAWTTKDHDLVIPNSLPAKIYNWGEDSEGISIPKDGGTGFEMRILGDEPEGQLSHIYIWYESLFVTYVNGFPDSPPIWRGQIKDIFIGSEKGKKLPVAYHNVIDQENRKNGGGVLWAAPDSWYNQDTRLLDDGIGGGYEIDLI